MKIRESQIASCAFSAAIELAKEYFERRDEPGPASRGASSAFRRRSCLVVADHTDRARSHAALRLEWSEHHALTPPTFVGFLTARPASRHVELILEGELEDAGALRELLGEVARHVEREWDRFVHETPSIEIINARTRPEVALV